MQQAEYNRWKIWVAGRAGVPMEVMGLMLGDFVDDYTVKVVDVFAMPQSGTGVSVEAVDPVYQTKMSEMLNQVGRCDSRKPHDWWNLYISIWGSLSTSRLIAVYHWLSPGSLSLIFMK